MIISIIVAAAENGAIGKNNQLPWRLPEDLKFFKKVTMGHHIIMGRKTYESIGKPLPGRVSLVITHDPAYSAQDIIVRHSLEDALNTVSVSGETEVFIIGGAEVINQSIKLADKIYLTEVKTAITDADVYLKEIDRSSWIEKNRTDYPADEKHLYAFSIVEMQRKY